ncbi:MAG: hypothetical protein APF76_12090 [Desulfitibacter sp. BRH_c19]|nr:MAG: hypothetical protein APF76_12090 [Desulfitibacter sp. BRH_c19]
MKLIIGITGATGAIYGIRILQALMEKADVETHLVISKWGRVTIETETEFTIDDLIAMADFHYHEDNLAAAISSGSFKCDGMIVAPCSMKTLAGIANGYTDDLIIRAADVAIKEKRNLILMVRETPLNAVHLENMLKLCKIGVTIAPPVPAFYTNPNSLDDLVNQTIGRILDNFNIEIDTLYRWKGL